MDERLATPRGLMVDRPRDRLLPRPRGPRQEQRLDGGGALGDRLAQGAHGRARAEERALDPTARVGQQLLRHLQLAGELGVAALELDLEPVHGEVGVDPREHLLRLEGLRHEVHGPRLEPAHLLPRLRERGEEDHGGALRLRVRLQPAARLVAIDARHHHVEQDEGRAGPVRDLERVLAARGDQQAVAAAVEGLPQEVEVRRLVVHEQDAPGRGRHLRSIVDARGPGAGDGTGARSMKQTASRGSAVATGRRPRRRRRDRGAVWAVDRRGGAISRIASAPTCRRWRDPRPVDGRPGGRSEGGGVGAMCGRRSLRWPPGGRRDRDLVKPASAIRGYAGYLVTDSEWRVVASDRPELLGQPAHFASDPAFTGRLRSEGAAITRPLPSLTPRLDAKGVVRAGAPTQFVCAWVASA
jgi:hypothetical protein